MPAGYLGFSRACEARERVVVAAVGDLLLHHELQIQATRAATRFRVLWAGVEDILQRADLTYANLEVPLAAGVLRSGEETTDPGLVFDSNFAKVTMPGTTVRGTNTSPPDALMRSRVSSMLGTPK